MTSPASHVESEWQFTALDVRPVGRWLESANIPGYSVVETGVKEVRDTYLDTDDWRLYRAGYTCRVRQKGESAELTLKTMAEAPGGLRQRIERNEELSEGGLESANIPGYSVVETGVKEVRDTYLDTDDWRLYRAGYTCRVRQKDESAELTLKTMAEAPGGLRQRIERNEELSEGGLEGATGDVSRTVRILAGRHRPRELFTLQQRRRLFRLGDTLGDLGEISLDETTIPLGMEDAPVRLMRVEVEVSDVERARRFVDVMAAATALVPAAVGKFQAALVATGMTPARPEVQLGSTAVDARMSAGDVAFAVLRKHFGVFLANEGGTRLGEDIEALHDMRVAARRLRAAMSLFRPFLPVRMEALRLQLGWVAAALGSVRDLDVQLERMAEWRAGFDEERGHALDAIEALIHVRRDAARERMLTVLNSRRYEVFVQRFSATLRRGPARRFAPGRTSILQVAPDLVEKRYGRVRKQASAIRKQSAPEAYHELRIDGKRLRYALEFVGPIYGKPATEFAARVAALQDVLGLHQDAYVAIDMLEEMARTQSRRLSAATVMAMGAIAERYRQDAISLRQQFPGVWKPLAGDEWTRLRKALESRRPSPPGPLPILPGKDGRRGPRAHHGRELES